MQEPNNWPLIKAVNSHRKPPNEGFRYLKLSLSKFKQWKSFVLEAGKTLKLNMAC